MKRSKVGTVDEYLAGVDESQRGALERLRRQIRAAAPGAEEYVTYQLPAFRWNGPLVAFGAAARHCAFYPMSGRLVAQFARELAGFETSKGTIRFQPAKPIPAALIRRMVKARMAENRARRSALAPAGKKRS